MLHHKDRIRRSFISCIFHNLFGHPLEMMALKSHPLDEISLFHVNKLLKNRIRLIFDFKTSELRVISALFT